MAARENPIVWDNLLYEIECGECVLVIGPDIVSFENGQTLFQLLCQKLNDTIDLKDSVVKNPQYIFQHEELLQPSSSTNLTPLRIFHQKFYWDRTEFDVPFSKIAQLPFSLIISLIPTERLSDIFLEMGRPHQFRYHKRVTHTQAVETIAEPSIKNTLIYNILGTVGTKTNKLNQSILTFDDLFTYLRDILSGDGLPNELIETLHKAETVSVSRSTF